MEKTISIKDKLLEEFQTRGEMKTSDVIQWGIRNYANTAQRKARILANEGKIKRMNKAKKLMKYGRIKEKIWVVVNQK